MTHQQWSTPDLFFIVGVRSCDFSLLMFFLFLPSFVYCLCFSYSFHLSSIPSLHVNKLDIHYFILYTLDIQLYFISTNELSVLSIFYTKYNINRCIKEYENVDLNIYQEEIYVIIKIEENIIVKLTLKIKRIWREILVDSSINSSKKTEWEKETSCNNRLNLYILNIRMI